MKNLWSREPVAIMAAFQAIIAVVVSFGVDLTAEQTGLLLAALAAVVGVFARSQVVPTVASPPDVVVSPVPPAGDKGEIGLAMVFLLLALILFLVVGAIGAGWITSEYIMAFLGFGLASWVLASLVP